MEIKPIREARHEITQSARAYRDIKRQIISLELPPGASFSESELATRLSRGKTPIREALLRLQRDGLVKAIPRSGYQVTALTLKEAQDLFAVRSLLEAEAARLATNSRSDSEQLHKLERLCRSSYDPTDALSIDRFNRANTEFHKGVARMSNNLVLEDMLGQILDRLERVFNAGLRLQSRADTIVHEHEELLDKIAAGDADAAAHVAKAQANASEQMVLEALRSSKTLLNANLLSDGRTRLGITAGARGSRLHRAVYRSRKRRP